MIKGNILSKRNLNFEGKTIAVIDRQKFKSSLSWIRNVESINFEDFKQLSNHALLLNIKREGNNLFSCFLSSITSKNKNIELNTNVISELMELKMSNGELRYIPKVIYKITFNRTELLDLLALQNAKSIELNNTVKKWDSIFILNDWVNMVELNDFHFVDLDVTKQTGIFYITIFNDKLSDINWDINVMKDLIANEEL